MADPRNVDVLVVGAGLSGIGAGYHLQKNCPERSFTIIEGRPTLGGTWDLFRYPGVRSDSDMHTLGYSFKPWLHEKSIADGASILAYLQETVDEFGISPRIRFNQRATQASWNSQTQQWTVQAEHPESGEITTYCANVLFMCSGYYSYKHGHRPPFAGEDDFAGEFVHPQEWPDDLDTSGKRIVVIGSGATAMTLLPALAKSAAHVTMLQRSPTYVVARPNIDVLANRLRKFLPDRLAYRLTRKKNIWQQKMTYKRTRTHPGDVRERLLGEVREQLGDEMTSQHFTPTYDPWDQRLCLIPNGDLFDVLKDGSASVVTDTIRRITTTGIELASGEHLDADLIVTATGLHLVTLGEMDFVVDDEQVDFSKTWTYKGVGYSGIPNLISTFGYINASWTLRSDLIAEYLCRVLNVMSERGHSSFTPTISSADAIEPRPWIDGFSAGYMLRAMPLLPKQAPKAPWVNPQSVDDDRELLTSPVEEESLIFD